MQALENIGVLEKDEERGGRRITQSGQRDLDRKCYTCYTPRRRRWGLRGLLGYGLTGDIGIAQTTLEESDEEDDE